MASKSVRTRSGNNAIPGIAITLLFIALVTIVLFLLLSSTAIQPLLNTLFAIDSVQVFWYVTRAAGVIAFLLLWLSTVWGLAVSNKIMDPVLERTFAFDFHEFLSLLAIGFTVLHVVVLLADQYLPFSLTQVLIPFIAPYRPIWIGVGVIGFYLTVIVSITFYIRRRIGNKTFRIIHYLSYLAYVATTLHGLLSGTDSPLLATQLMYIGTALSVVFLTVYRITISVISRRAHRV